MSWLLSSFLGVKKVGRVGWCLIPNPWMQLWMPISQFLLEVVLSWQAWLSLVQEVCTSSVWFWESFQGTRHRSHLSYKQITTTLSAAATQIIPFAPQGLTLPVAFFWEYDWRHFNSFVCNRQRYCLLNTGGTINMEALP